MKHSIAIMINNVEKEKEYTKYLGVIIGNKVSWVHHIKHANFKVSKAIGILTKVWQFVSNDVLYSLI